VADLLFGDANPGGKLPVTFPRTVGQVPIYYAHTLTHQPEGSPGFVSRYWDEPSSPLYPFGYGLSYTTFKISNLKVENHKVSVDVQNTGARAGDEVVQLYIHQKSGRASRPVRLLKGFERVTLAPGESKTVHFTLTDDELSYWSATDRKWVHDRSDFDVWVGSDSNATLHGTLSPVQ
jgi:beta-glucosidase